MGGRNYHDHKETFEGDRFITSIGVTVSGDMHIRMPKLTNLHTCNVCTSPYVDNTPRKRFLNYQHDTLGVI